MYSRIIRGRLNRRGFYNLGTAPAFSGDFAALATTYSLTVKGFWRGDLGVSGTTGTGKALWTNQSGTFGNIAPDVGATDGIGSVGAGLNGRASVITNGSTQRGAYTATAQVAPNTTNLHKWIIAREISPTGGVPRGVLQMTGGSSDIYMATAVAFTMATAGGAPVAINITDGQWYRGRFSFTGGVAGGDEIRMGSISTTGTGGNTAPNTGRFFSDLLTNWEWLCYMELEGTKANFLLFDADASVKAQAFWTNAIAI